MLTRTQTVKALAKRFIERAEALQLKGRRRDNAALDYFVGAAVLAELNGDADLSNHLGTISALIISVRGFFGVKELATD